MTDCFRKRLIQIRAEKQIDAANLSLMAGLNRRAVTDIEKGASKNPTLRSAYAISKALNVSLVSMISETPRADMVKEWEDFLSQFPADEQRNLLRAVQSLQEPSV